MSPDMIILLGGFGFSMTLLLAFWNGPDSSPSLKKRLDRVCGSGILKRFKTTEHHENLRRNTSDSNIALFDRIIKSTLPNPQRMRERLARTGKNLTLGEYLIINALTILVAYLVFSNIVGWTKGVSVLMGLAVGLYLPHKITGRMGNKRILKFLGNFPEAIDTICRGLRSGLPITETIATVGHELPNPIGLEFTRVSDGVRMGRTLEESLWEIAGRLDTPEFRFFIIALAIQKETGGNLAETLGNLSDLLRKRRQLKLKIRAMSSEARASAMIIGSLPFLMFGLLMAVNSEYVMILLTDPRGQYLFGSGLTWLGMGVLVMKKMISFDF